MVNLLYLSCMTVFPNQRRNLSNTFRQDTISLTTNDDDEAAGEKKHTLSIAAERTNGCESCKKIKEDSSFAPLYPLLPYCDAFTYYASDLPFLHELMSTDLLIAHCHLQIARKLSYTFTLHKE